MHDVFHFFLQNALDFVDFCLGRFDDQLIVYLQKQTRLQFLVPQALPEVKGLRVLRAGLELGAVLKNRIAPAHAWALWLETLESSVSLEESDPLLARYLSGDVLPSDKRGWTLVQADGLSLGWAKGDGSQLKNHYPKALRRPV